jgi:hypothetical protein
MTDDLTPENVLTLPMRKFSQSIEKKSATELFELFQTVTAAQTNASTGSAEGETDLMHKSLVLEGLISRHNNGGGLTKYNEWLIGR